MDGLVTGKSNRLFVARITTTALHKCLARSISLTPAAQYATIHARERIVRSKILGHLKVFPVSSADMTLLLRDASSGSTSAADQLMAVVYDELRRLAQHYLAQERADHTLQATELVHEAYLKLVDQRRSQWRDRAHFFAVAAQAIRRILVDHARTRKRAKRGGGERPQVLDESVAAGELGPGAQTDLVALDEALQDLAGLNERQARIVEMRFFGGLSLDEIAELLGVSPRTVDGEWAMARAWLLCRLQSGTS